jgi:hypothetical protein
MMKKKRRDYSLIKYNDLPKVLEPGERKVIRSNFIIDRGCWQHLPEEKLRLKYLKKRHKDYLRRQTRKNTSGHN